MLIFKVGLVILHHSLICFGSWVFWAGVFQFCCTDEAGVFLNECEEAFDSFSVIFVRIGENAFLRNAWKTSFFTYCVVCLDHLRFLCFR